MNLVAAVTELYEAGVVTFPHAANYFGTAASELHKTALNDAEVFIPMGDGTGTREFEEVFISMRDLIQDHVLVATHDSLVKAGQALASIAQSIAEQDCENGDALEKAFHEVESNPNAPMAPPEKSIPAPTSRSPHP